MCRTVTILRYFIKTGIQVFAKHLECYFNILPYCCFMQARIREVPRRYARRYISNMYLFCALPVCTATGGGPIATNAYAGSLLEIIEVAAVPPSTIIKRHSETSEAQPL